MSAIVALRILQTLIAAGIAFISFFFYIFLFGIYSAPFFPIFGAYAALPILSCLSGLTHLVGMCGSPKSRGTMKFYIFSDVFFACAVTVCAAMQAYLGEAANSVGGVMAGFVLIRVLYILGMRS
jgi:hypothetical protein